MEEEKTQRKSKSIKLYCPSISKITQIIAYEDQRLDLGTIARTFGLEPSKLKLNGHFLSRGIDLVSSSVTWRSLLSFFSSRGFSTGTHGSAALIVDGKLSNSGTKRSHDPTEVDDGVDCARLHGKKPQQEDIKSPNSKKLKENNNDHEKYSQRAKCSDETGLKRKHWLENISPFKKLRVNGSYSVDAAQGHDVGGNKRHCPTKLPCGYPLRENMKTREDEVLMAAPLKRTR